MPSYNLVKGTTYSTGMTVTAANLNAHVDVAKITFTASDILVGRASSGAGDWEDVSCTAVGRAMIGALTVAAQQSLLGLGPLDSPTFTNVTLTGALVASSFAGAFNGTVGATTPSTGAFTTGGFSGQQSNGTGGTGTNTSGINLNGGSGVAGGGLISFTRNSANPIYVGNAAPVLGGTTNDGIFYAATGQSLLIYADGAQKGLFSSTGLAVTGKTNSNGFNATQNGDGYRWGGASDGSTGQLAWNAATDVFFDFLGTLHFRRLTGGTNTIMDVTGSGIAVTGIVSSTQSLNVSRAGGQIGEWASSNATGIYLRISVNGISTGFFGSADQTTGGPATDIGLNATNALRLSSATGGAMVLSGSVLAVTGAISATGAHILADGTPGTATGAVYFANDADTGLYRSGANTIGFMGNGLSIGTWSPTGITTTGGATIGSQLKAGTGAGVFGTINSGFSTGTVGVDITSNDNASGASFIVFRDSAFTNIGSVTRVGATAAVAYNTTSDGRLKENVRDFTGFDSGPIIDALYPRWFDWKGRHDPDARDIVGFVAQELAHIGPIMERIGAITPGDDSPELDMKTGRQWQRSDTALIPILVAELKALRARVAVLEAN